MNKIDQAGARGGRLLTDGTFGYYRLAREPGPARPRSDHNPLHREEYLLHVRRRTGHAGGAWVLAAQSKRRALG